MIKSVVVREYARLTTEPVPTTLSDAQINTTVLDEVQITSTAFEWLCDFAANSSKSGVSLLLFKDRRSLKLDNYVGIIETPCGTILEILPKVTGHDDLESSRNLLKKMLRVALEIPPRQGDKTNTETFKHPLMEWVMAEFTLSLSHLLKRGIRFDYQRIEEEQCFLSGQLDMVKRMRQPPGMEHIFPIRHDVFMSDRPENRLLVKALKRVCLTTKEPGTWRLSHELAGMLYEIPESQDIKGDFRQWQGDRLMAHYQLIRPWCELVLGNDMPLAFRGKTHGISLLFPMEKLFEKYVEYYLSQEVKLPNKLYLQEGKESLCFHNGKKMFQLRPDFMIRKNDQTIYVLDAKWKLISETERENTSENRYSVKYGLSQADFYQLFAYGQKYLKGSGDMLLIYPKTDKFTKPLAAPFVFLEESGELRLWVVPFDLENDILYWPDGLIKADFAKFCHTESISYTS
jgi:5-methylcytosine-specific restriction enzyme subunit McrC